MKNKPQGRRVCVLPRRKEKAIAKYRICGKFQKYSEFLFLKNENLYKLLVFYLPFFIALQLSWHKHHYKTNLCH